jgi:UDP-N-acetylmuramyl pentapeptide synthase
MGTDLDFSNAPELLNMSLSIAGRVLLALYPKAIFELAKGKKIICVSGTNGKTSTTKALVSIISQLGSVATSPSGSNLERGVAAALMTKSEYAVLEVDELHLSRVIDEAKPKVVLLLNLTRDQLHRMHEVKRVADRWAKSASVAPETLFVGDIDDPFVALALNSAAQSQRISFGGNKHKDAAVCPSCGKYLKWVRNNYKCTCGLSNSNPDETFESGSAAYRNATMANVVGKFFGAKPITIDEKSLERSVDQIRKGVKANKEKASQDFAVLNEVISFPTTIFIGRDGNVKRIHTGFNGPGTGKYYTEYVEKTNALIEALLAE